MATITSTAGGGDWSNTASWSGAVVPGTGDTVIIATTTGNQITLTDNRLCASIQINNDAHLYHNAGTKLTVETNNYTVNAGSNYGNLGGNFTFELSGGVGCEVEFLTVNKRIFCNNYAGVQIQFTGGFVVGSEPHHIHGTGVLCEAPKFDYCVGVIGDLKITSATGPYGLLRVFNYFETTYLGDFNVHLGQITYDDCIGYMVASHEIYTHADTLITFQNCGTGAMPGANVVMYSSDLYGHGTFNLDYTDYLSTVKTSAFSNVTVRDSVSLTVQQDGTNRLWNQDCATNTPLEAFETSSVDIMAKTSFNMWGHASSNITLRHVTDVAYGMFPYVQWLSDGNLEIHADTLGNTGNVALFSSSVRWLQRDTYNVSLHGSITGIITINPSGEILNSGMSLTKTRKFINEMNTDLTFNKTVNHYEPLIHSTDEAGLIGQIYYEFAYPTNRIDASKFQLTDASWDLANEEIDILANGSVILKAQPFSFLSGQTGIVLTNTGTLTIEFTISTDGGSTFPDAPVTLNDANWIAATGYGGSGLEVIKIIITETAGATARLQRIRLPFLYEAGYTSALSTDELLSTILGKAIDIDLVTAKILFDASNYVKSNSQEVPATVADSTDVTDIRNDIANINVDTSGLEGIGNTNLGLNVKILKEVREL